MKATMLRLMLATNLSVTAFLSPAGEPEFTPDLSASAIPVIDLEPLLKAKSFTNGVGMVMVRISPKFWAGAHLVTQADYQAVTGGNPSRFQGATLPVDSVSWNEAMSFCRTLTAKEKDAGLLPKGFSYTLPTQAQWASLMGGSTLEQAVTSVSKPRTGTAPVGSLQPNKQGLYDTRGNLWQWCLDPQHQPYRVLKGGAWNSSLEMNLRPDFRWYSKSPDERQDTFGFRVVLAPAR